MTACARSVLRSTNEGKMLRRSTCMTMKIDEDEDDEDDDDDDDDDEDEIIDDD